MSKFEIRGFIEGFYGRVWSDEKRRKVLKLVAAKGMNSYFYAPKDDPYLRQKWRLKYDEKSLEKFSELFGFTKDIGIELFYCLSPGLDIRYSSEEDHRIIAEKFDSLYKIGVRSFGLFLDDIPDVLTNEADIERFDSVCDAHIHLINSVYSKLPQGASLTVCPMIYNGKGDEEYIVSLCRGIPSAVRVFWTGKKICSPELTAGDAEFFYRQTGKKPLYWDNFPVNDAEMYGEMHIGPYRNRDAELADFSEGIVSNVMEYPICSAIPLLTICDFLNDPENYDPEISFAEAVETITGEKFEKWMPFFDHTDYSCLNDRFSVYLSDALAAARGELLAGRKENAVFIISKLIREYKECSETMKKNEILFKELEKWISRFDEITAILEYEEKFVLSDGKEFGTELKDTMIKYNGNAYKLAGFGLRESAEYLLGEFTI